MRDRQAGFTLIEMMVVVAVIAILAAIALPGFFSESRKSKAFAEVQPMFNDLRIRLEQFLQENGKYPVTSGEIATNPPGVPGTTRRALDLTQQEWKDLKVRVSGSDQVYCNYTWSTGLANDDANVSTQAKLLGFTKPTTDWYYLLAKCDMDGDHVKFSYYLSSSVNPEIQRLDEGN